MSSSGITSTMFWYGLSSSLRSQWQFLDNKKITVEEIYSGAFRAKGMDELQSMKNTNQYTVLNYDAPSRSMQIDLFDFATLKKVSTLIDTKNHSVLTDGIDSYTFSPDEKLILIANNSNSIYRHSFTADYYLYDTTTKSVSKLFDFQVQEPTFSPDGKKIAFARENNLYVYDIASKQTTAITTDGKKNSVINGITDWVYEEEFAFVRAFDWSKDSKKVAYIRFDESQVPEFSMSIFKKDLYPTVETFKYPKAGEKNSEVSLHIYDIASRGTQKVNLSQYADFYIARMQWTNEANVLSAQVLNRHQDNLDLLFVDGNSGAAKVVLNEKDKAYVDVTDNLTFLKDNSFIWTSEKDGFNHIYLYDKTGKLKNQVTKGNWEVTNYYGFDEKTNTVFYQSVENGSINRDVYSINLNGKNKVRLSKKTGTNAATFSPNFQYFINTFSSATQPTTYTLNEAKTGAQVQVIENNEALASKLKAYNLPAKEFFVLKTAKGNELNAWILKPKDFDPTKKYPVLVYVYGGPHAQMITNSYLDGANLWMYWMAEQGYLVFTVDNRGSDNRGFAFESIIHGNLGNNEMDDQLKGVDYLKSLPYVDGNRLAVHGWSYGGFMTTSLMLRKPDTFKVGVAGGPVIDWKWYEVMYGERYMDTPAENAKGFEENTVYNYVKNLKGKLLLIHGTNDDVVVEQHNLSLVKKFVEAGKQVDYFPYPMHKHNVTGKDRVHLIQKVLNYVIENNK